MSVFQGCPGSLFLLHTGAAADATARMQKAARARATIIIAAVQGGEVTSDEELDDDQKASLMIFQLCL